MSGDGQSQGTGKVPGGHCQSFQEPPGLGGAPRTPLQRPRRRIKLSPGQPEPARSSPGRLGVPSPTMGPPAQPWCRRGRGANPG